MKRVFSLSHYERRDRIKRTLADKIKGTLKSEHPKRSRIACNDNFLVADMLSRTVVLMRSSSLDRNN
jgi:hypothetical protein